MSNQIIRIWVEYYSYDPRHDTGINQHQLTQFVDFCTIFEIEIKDKRFNISWKNGRKKTYTDHAFQNIELFSRKLNNLNIFRLIAYINQIIRLYKPSNMYQLIYFQKFHQNKIFFDIISQLEIQTRILQYKIKSPISLNVVEL